MTVTLPPRPYQAIIYRETENDVDPRAVAVCNRIQDKGQLLQLAEAFVTRGKGQRTLWRALPPKTKVKVAKLMPIEPLYLEAAYFYHIYPSNLKLPKLIQFDRVAFKVKSAVEKEFKIFEFTLENDPTKKLIKAGHGPNPALRPLTLEEERAFSAHFDLDALEAELKRIETPDTETMLTHKKWHHFDLMRQWWAKAIWNTLGAPVAMPYWISSLGGWELVHQYQRPTSFSSDAVAHCLNLALSLEWEVGVPLLDGSWEEIKDKLIVVDGKVLLASRVPTFAMASFDRSPLLEAIKQGDPLLFAKLKRPVSFERAQLVKEHRKEPGEVLKLKTLALIHALCRGKNVRHYITGSISPTPPSLKDELFLLSALLEAGALSPEKANSLMFEFISKPLTEYVEERRQEWIQKRTSLNVLTLISEWSFGCITRS